MRWGLVKAGVFLLLLLILILISLSTDVKFFFNSSLLPTPRNSQNHNHNRTCVSGGYYSPQVCNTPSWQATDYERLEPSMTGPRTEKPRQRGLLAMPIGGKSADLINSTVYKFLDSRSGRVILFAYDMFDWSRYLWFSDERVIFVRHLKQMKWWFLKRFVTPLTVDAYDYLWLCDDDARFDWDPNDVMSTLDEFKIELSQPAHMTQSPCTPSVWSVTHHVNGTQNGRWTDFVEIGPLVIISKSLWNRCIWNFVQDDLSSGFGLDEMWYHACNQPRTAVLDKWQMCHVSTHAASSQQRLHYNPEHERPEYSMRFPHVDKSRFPGSSFGSF